MHDEVDDAAQVEWCKEWSEKEDAEENQKGSALVQFQNLSEICLV